MDGILLVDKPPGITSAGAVAVVKRAVRPSKVGHLGTLDPFASGLLPLAIGEATKIATYLAGADKGYHGTVRLGVLTDTLDSTGRVVEESPVPQLAQVDLPSLAGRFLGPLDQIPPEFSAIKQGGVPMYRLARRGQAPPLAPRRIVVHELRLEARGADRLTIEVRCSKGTYVRSLARDLGLALGCAAHLESLRRVSFGQFELGQAVPLDELRAESPREAVRARAIDPLAALASLRRLAVDAASAARLRAGQQGSLSRLSPPAAAGELACVVEGEGGLVAVIAEAAGHWRIDRVFADRTRLARPGEAC